MKKFMYIDKTGILHIVSSKEGAEKNSANGKVIETEYPAEGGYPVAEVNGIKEEVIVYDEEHMKVSARGKYIDVIPELAELYRQCM